MGLDPQGIPWNNLDTSRVEYRKSRLENYMNYENLRPEQRPASAAALQAEISSHHVESDAQFFEFESNERQLRSSIVHFQLRNLVWSTSSHDVLVTHINEIVHYGYHSEKATPVRVPNHLSNKNTFPQCKPHLDACFGSFACLSWARYWSYPYCGRWSHACILIKSFCRCCCCVLLLCVAAGSYRCCLVVTRRRRAIRIHV